MTMRLRAVEYRRAARARIRAADLLHAAGEYAAAIYLAGVAVECALHAHRMRIEPAFEGRHDLPELLRASGLRGYVPEKRRAEVVAALGHVWSRWKNDYRYVSNERLLRDLRDRRLTLGLRGDALKENSRTVLENARFIVDLGDVAWKST